MGSWIAKSRWIAGKAGRKLSMVTAVRPIIRAIRATNSTKPGPAQPDSGRIISGLVAPPLALLAMVIPRGRLSREGGRQRRRGVTQARRTRKARGGMAAMRHSSASGGAAFASAKPCGATFRRDGRKWRAPPLSSRLIGVANSAT